MLPPESRSSHTVYYAFVQFETRSKLDIFLNPAAARNVTRPRYIFSIPQSLLYRNLLKYMPRLESGSMPIRVSACDYTDAYAGDKLVMLTNESRSPLRQLDPHRHYVLGACVKLDNQNRFLHAKATEHRLETARIPFDLCCSFRTSKLLPLDHLAQILLEFKYNANWDKAFEFIERRRLK